MAPGLADAPAALRRFLALHWAKPGTERYPTTMPYVRHVAHLHKARLAVGERLERVADESIGREPHWDFARLYLIRAVEVTRVVPSSPARDEFLARVEKKDRGALLTPAAKPTTTEDTMKTSPAAAAKFPLATEMLRAFAAPHHLPRALWIHAQDQQREDLGIPSAIFFPAWPQHAN
jgi:hypothetical protein